MSVPFYWILAVAALPVCLCSLQELKVVSCNQSSDFTDDHTCEKAINGNMDQHYYNLSCSHVGAEAGWWVGSLIKMAWIKQIRLYNRQYSSAERTQNAESRLNDFVITVDGTECATYKSKVSFLVKNFYCDVIGTHIKIKSNLPYLTLCEVQVFGEPLNDPLPLIKCKQSSIQSGQGCKNSLEDDSPMVNNSGGRCSRLSQEPGWWSAETVKPALIKLIEIFHREDDKQERLTDFTISVDGVACVRHNSSVTFIQKTFRCNANGQAIKISSNKEYLILTLCKVVVYGEYVQKPEC